MPLGTLRWLGIKSSTPRALVELEAATPLPLQPLAEPSAGPTAGHPRSHPPSHPAADQCPGPRLFTLPGGCGSPDPPRGQARGHPTAGLGLVANWREGDKPPRPALRGWFAVREVATGGRVLCRTPLQAPHCCPLPRAPLSPRVNPPQPLQTHTHTHTGRAEAPQTPRFPPGRSLQARGLGQRLRWGGPATSWPARGLRGGVRDTAPWETETGPCALHPAYLTQWSPSPLFLLFLHHTSQATQRQCVP